MQIETYSDNIYTESYYLTQYILSTVCIKKKYCVLLLSKEEVYMLQERIPDITYEKLYEVKGSNQLVYQLYQE